jgi:hypothetical protein
MAGRNTPCPCGSGKKYKHCCALKESRARSQRSIWTGVLVALVLLGGLFLVGVAFTGGDEARDGAAPGRVWSEEHGHWHDAP